MSRAPRWYTLSMKSYLLAVLTLSAFAAIQGKTYRWGGYSSQGWPLTYRARIDYRVTSEGAVQWALGPVEDLHLRPPRDMFTASMVLEQSAGSRSMSAFRPWSLLGNAGVGIAIGFFSAGLLEWRLRRRKKSGGAS